MKYQRDGVVYHESEVREKLLELGYNDYDFEEKAEELGYRPIGEIAARQAINEGSLLLEGTLNEGFFQWAKMKVISWSIGILPERELNKLWEKGMAKLTPEQRKQVQGKKFSKKDKVNVLRSAIRKEYEENPSYRKKVESVAEKIKDEVKKAKEDEKGLREGFLQKASIVLAIAHALLFLISFSPFHFFWAVAGTTMAVFNPGDE